MLWIRQVLLISLLALAVGGIRAAPDGQQIDDLAAFTTLLRIDIEIAADEQFGAGNRPDNWTANVDSGTVTYISDLWFDKELLANAAYGSGLRPDDWLGVTSDVTEIIARNTRYDLELVADEIFGVDVRPDSWNGALPLFRCERTLQNAYALLIEFYGFATTIPADAFGFCTLFDDEIQTAVLETNQLDISGEVLDQAILAVRGDIERIANEVYGVNSRPIGWAGNVDIESPLILTDNYADINILADDTLGDGNRPLGWLGLITESRVETFRNQRYDLELLADEVVPNFPTIEGARPRGWQNTDPLRTCPPNTQDIVLVLEPNFTEPEAEFSRSIVPDSETYCEDINREANLFVENRALLEPEDTILLAIDGVYEADFAFAYLDLTALEYMGAIPRGTRFRAWYRNYRDSTMMFVSGEDFAVYIDRRWTNMPQDVFDRLPSVEGVRPLTFCNADWCDGPGPTPTPTGGAIESLLAFQTPVIADTPVPVNEASFEEKTEYNFENVRITYVQDDIETRTALVALELCQEPQLVTCEPVLRVFDESIDAEKPIVSQQNGLNVYEFSYGFTASLIIESANFISRNIFVSDPTLPRD